MPELPEVEVIVRGLRPHLLGRRIGAVWVSGKALRHSIPLAALEKDLCGKRITTVSRRAKYALLQLADQTILVLHLGMSGNLGIFAKDSCRRKHDHLELLLDDGQMMRLHDPRRFGSVHLFTGENASLELGDFFAKTGPEPLSEDFGPDYLMSRAEGRQLTVKQFVMTNEVVAGIGNIYANEALYLAAIHPATRVSGIGRKDWQRLARAIQEVLLHAIDCGGSTISDFLNVGQESGYFQINFKVYGRDGKSCSCGAVIKKNTIGGRASYWCPGCQSGDRPQAGVSPRQR